MTKEDLIKMARGLSPAERQEIARRLSEETEEEMEGRKILQADQEQLVVALRNRGLTLRRWTVEEIERIWEITPRPVGYEELDAAFKKLDFPLSEQIIRDRGNY